MPNERNIDRAAAVERMAAEIDAQFIEGERWDVAVEPIEPVAPGARADGVWEHFARQAQVRGGRIPMPVWLRDDNAKPAPQQVPGGKQGKELFTLILQGIREIYDTDAIIAGGAIRDVVAGAPFHADVDVFVPMPWETFAKGVQELGWQGPTEVIQMEAYKKPIDDMGFKSVGRVRSYVQRTMVDLVFIDKPLCMEDVSAFPIHAQRGVFTLENGLVLSPEARNDIENKQFTIDASITDKDRVTKLIEKIKVWQRMEVYKGWKIITPDLKEWWEEKEEVVEPQKLLNEMYKIKVWNGVM